MQEKQKNQFDKLALDIFRSKETSRSTHIMPSLKANLDWIKKNKKPQEDSLTFLKNEGNIVKRLKELKELGANMQHLALKTSYFNYPLVTEFLIHSDVNFDIFNKQGTRLIYIPIKNSVKKVLNKLITNNSVDFHFKDPHFNEEQVLHQLLRYAHITEAEHVLSVDPNLLYSKDKFGNSFLYFACIGLENSKTKINKECAMKFILSKIDSDFNFIYEHRQEIPLSLKEVLGNLIIEKNYQNISSLLPNHNSNKMNHKI